MARADGNRRRPMATLVVVLVSVGVFLAVGRGAGPAAARIRTAEDAVWRYWAANPRLELDRRFVDAAVPPPWRGSVVSELQARGAAAPASAADEQSGPRRTLGELTTAYFESLASHPHRRWGLVPARPSPVGAVVALVLFPGWPALLIGGAFLLLAGPPLERAAGSLAFAGLFCAGAVAGVVVPALLAPSSWWPVVGAAAGVATVLGGVTAWFAGGAVPLVALRRGRAPLQLPTALLLPWWLGLVMLTVMVTPLADGRRTLALAVAVALGAVLGGLGLRRGLAPAKAGAAASPDLVEGLQLLAGGETARAREALRRVLSDDPGRAEANLAMWESFVRDGTPGHGVEHMVRVIETDLRRRDPERAWEHWRELLTRAGTAGPSALRWRIAGELRGVDPERARDVLTQLADDVDAGIVSEKARHQLAAEVPVEAAPFPTAEMPPAADVAPFGSAGPPPGGAAPAGAAPLEPGLEELSLPKLRMPAAGPAPSLVLEACLLEQLQPEGLLLRGEDGQTRLLAYRTLAAVAVGGIADSAKPYVVLDLLPVAEPGRTRRGCRLVSTQFDPRRFIAQSGLTPMEAFRELVRVISGAAGARLLPGPEALRQIPVYPTPAAYDREVLGLLSRS